MAKKEFLKMSLVQKGDFIKAGTGPVGPKNCPGTMRRDWLYTLELGEIRSRGSFLKRFSHAKDSQVTGGLAIVKLRLFFPLSKALTLRQ